MSGFVVPMTTATGMGPLPFLLEEMAGARSLQRAFNREGLPLAIVEERSAQLPLASLMGLFDGAAREVGDRLFGYRVGEAMKPGEYGFWIQFSVSAATLAGALKRTVRSIDTHQTWARMSLRRSGSDVIWSYHCPTGLLPGVAHADHVFPVMIRFVRAYAGDTWRPKWVQVDYRDDGSANILEDACQAPVRFGDSISVPIPIELLTLRRRSGGGREANRIVTSTEVLADAAKRRATDPQNVVEALVALRLLEGWSDIEGVAQFLDGSVRALQRTLNDAGTSYREVLDRTRFRRAAALIRETDESLTEVALSLGYSDPANFTRAFHRWAGVSPTQFRMSRRPAGQAG